ncbi:kinetochore complex Sim4 subunit Fta1-domain-containing protein [Triangularia verruculosa]|uniref:Kinetochore complex Sim4 subunit Fta1-domain-containing protein n=1 Tax=Triangularia verruculosa TaxID=2587418 RepID=A0AAN7AXQ0_9PEZI|nr:kinetochore complex Sim4 subunit Fta1-domain-containing protein [Triangularia verruculosa]
MPPRRGQPPPPSPTTASANPDQSNITISTTQTDADPATFKLYDVTFTLHRVSPLFLGSHDTSLSKKRLHTLAQRLRDVLVGDVVRGVEVGLGTAAASSGDDNGNPLARLGSLDAVVMRSVDVCDLLDASLERLQEQFEYGAHGEDPTELWKKLKGRLQGKQGLTIELVYESGLCEALLLPDLSGSQSTPSSSLWSSSSAAALGGKTDGKERPFLCLPLMLMRMPSPLKSVVSEFLAAEFDCKVSQCRLGTRTMMGGLERWMQTLGKNKTEQQKDLLVAFGFDILPLLPKLDVAEGPADKAKLGLNTADVIIPAQKLPVFLQHGQGMEQDEIARRYEEGGVRYEIEPQTEQQLLARRLKEEGWGWVDEGQQPFTQALSRYVKFMLKLELFHPAVRVIKVACSGFVVVEGRIKIFRTMDRAAVVDWLGLLCERAMVQQID